MKGWLGDLSASCLNSEEYDLVLAMKQRLERIVERVGPHQEGGHLVLAMKQRLERIMEGGGLRGGGGTRGEEGGRGGVPEGGTCLPLVRTHTLTCKLLVESGEVPPASQDPSSCNAPTFCKILPAWLGLVRTHTGMQHAG